MGVILTTHCTNWGNYFGKSNLCDESHPIAWILQPQSLAKRNSSNWNTVDGKNPAPVDRQFPLLSHQQYHQKHQTATEKRQKRTTTPLRLFVGEFFLVAVAFDNKKSPESFKDVLIETLAPHRIPYYGSGF